MYFKAIVSCINLQFAICNSNIETKRHLAEVFA